MSELIKIDRPAPRVLRVLINRPEKRNAIDQATREALIKAVTAAQADPDCGALVLGGVDHVFSAGGDLPSMVGINEQQARERMRHGHQLCRLVTDSPFPVVSAAEGFCAGAVVGIALLGDWIVAGSGTRILFPFLRIGLAPDWGLLRSLPARVGIATARRLLFGGKPVTGEEAMRIGLVDSYVEAGDVMAAAVAQASALASLSPAAFARSKRRLQQASATLDEALQREEDDQSTLLTGPDFREGYAAFIEKREPQFTTKKGSST